jgi:very-short-patch-repair endonuclease
VARDAELRRRGFSVLRFWNNDINRHIEGVVETTFRTCEAAPPHPSRLSSPSAR